MSSKDICRRVRRRAFTQIDNEPINDPDLRYEDIGLLTYVMSKPNDWVIYKTELITSHGNGRESVAGILKRLEAKGYLLIVRHRNSSGQFTNNEYVFTDIPYDFGEPQDSSVENNNTPENPHQTGASSMNGKPYTGSRIRETVNGNPSTTNTIYNNTINNNNSSSNNNNSCRIFEKEFGRPLSPIERETLQSWFNDFSEELVIYALKVAVLGDNRTFRYIQGILDHWQGEGVKCIQDVGRLEQQHQAEKQRRTKPGKRISIAEHNGQVLPELFIENKTSREEIIQIFDSHGLNLQKARKALRYLATLNASTIKTIAKALSQKNKTVKNPVGLLESNPQAIAKAVLSGSLYPEGKKPREVPICETTGREYAVYAPL